MNKLLPQVEFCQQVSEDLAKIIRIKSQLRGLTPAEIESLQQQGNYSKDWDKIFVHPHFSVVNIHFCHFKDENLFLPGETSNTSQIELYSSTLQNCWLEPCRIYRINLLQNYYLKQGASVESCSSLVWDVSQFNLHQNMIPLGSETGHRKIKLFEIYSTESAFYFLNNPSAPSTIPTWNPPNQGVIGRDTSIRNCSKLYHNLFSNDLLIDGCNGISNSLVLSKPHHQTFLGSAVIIENSVILPGSRVDHGAQIQNSVLLEHSKSDESVFITNSVIGPYCHVSRGEITNSLLGPFTALHHQSLLISALWPKGKGNIGYGANVGSNHTGKLPDQEIYPGEGCFFGLGSSIKFPCNFTLAPYSIISTGVILPPQQCQMPFSLIIPNSQSPSGTEILPAWVWLKNTYVLFRNMSKYKSRNSHQLPIPFSIFRLEIISQVVRALEELEQLSLPIDSKLIEPSPSILGSNSCTPTSLELAKKAYRQFLSVCYAYFRYFQSTQKPVLEFAHFHDLEEFNSVKEKIKHLISSENIHLNLAAIPNQVVAPLVRDFSKGIKIDPNYSLSHPDPYSDPIYLKVVAEFKILSEIPQFDLN